MAYLPTEKKGTTLLIVRLNSNSLQTQSLAYILDENYNTLHCMAALELSDKDNRKNVSRIPTGVYNAFKIIHHKFGHSAILKNVPNRSEIMIHKGNFSYQTKGCVLLGYDFKDLDNDGLKDVTNSGTTMSIFYRKLTSNFKVIIR